MTKRRRAALGFDQDIDRVGSIIPKVEADAMVRELGDGGGDGAGGEIPACGEDDGVAGTAQATVENQFVAIETIAGWRGVGFRNAQAQRLAWLYGWERN